MEFEFGAEREEFATGPAELGSEDERVVLVLGILVSEEKQEQAEKEPWNKGEEREKAEKAKPIDRIDLYLL